MHITLMTMGTLGDVRPFIALAYGLEERGHRVTLAGPVNFTDYVEKDYRRQYVPIGLNSQEVLESEQGRRWMASGNAKQFLKEMNRILHDNRFAMERDSTAACRDCDLIIAHPLMLYYGCFLSEKRNIPLIVANTFPMAPATSAFPHMLFSTKSMPFGFLNKWTHTLVHRVYENNVREDMNEWRKKLGLPTLKGVVYPKLERQRVPMLQAFSPELVPRPKEWGDHVAVTGYWKIPARHMPEKEKAALPEDLSAWLDQGPPPIYFGFGSLPVLEPLKMVRTAVNIARALHTRAVIASGWSRMELGADAPPDTVKLIASANHELLFPRCEAVVHHGGTGTTHTALESGTPSVILSTFADQPFWGARLVERDIGRHIPFSALSETNLHAAISELRDPALRERCARIARRMRSSNGLEQALNELERLIPLAPVYRN